MATSRVIRTDRLLIMPFEESHLTERYVGWLNDPEVVKFSEQRFKKHTYESCLAYMHSFDNVPDYFWAIVSRESAIGHMGNISARVHTDNMTADVAILIGEKTQWGRGYGLEAFLAVVDFLFREANMRKVTSGTMAVNKGMLRIMERAGMTDDGWRHRHFIYQGQEVDLIHRALFREDWLD